MGLKAKRILGDPLRQRQEHLPPIPMDPATLVVKRQKQHEARSNSTITLPHDDGDVYATIETEANGSNFCNHGDDRAVLCVGECEWQSLAAYSQRTSPVNVSSSRARHIILFISSTLKFQHLWMAGILLLFRPK
jgi:hypothetical protein